MAVATRGTGSNYLQRAPSPSGLVEVLDLILDKGLVIDAYVRVSLVGIELLTIDARIVIASVDTYLRFAEAVNRLDLAAQSRGLPEIVGDLQESGAGEKVKGVGEKAKGALEPAAEGGREKLGAAKERARETVDRTKEKVTG